MQAGPAKRMVSLEQDSRPDVDLSCASARHCMTCTLRECCQACYVHTISRTLTLPLFAQELAKEPALVTLLLKGPLLKHLAKSLLSPTDQLVQHAAVLLQYMALNAQPDQLLAAEIKAVMSSLAQYSLMSDNWLLKTAVGSAACSLPPALLLPDVKPPLPSPPKTPPPPPLPLSKFIWDAMDYEKSSPKQFAVA